jgi:hypothetical protein
VEFAPKNYADAQDNAAKVIFATFVAHQFFLALHFRTVFV